MASNPLEQFKVYTIIELPRLFGYDINFTNSSLFMMISVILMMLFLLFGIRKRSVIPGYLQAAVEYIYDFVISIIESNTGSKGLKHIPLVFTVFIFVLSCNLVGILPYGFTVTSHIIVTFALSMVVFVYVTIVGFKERGVEFLRILLPKGVPLVLAPLILPIELFTYLARPISLSIRLAANMVAGHTIIKVIAGFIVNMNVFLTPVPFLFIIMLIGFEIFVAVLQAYIFTSLTCVYLSDTVK
ncbi:F0F1 ATP synthase subunit A [Wolbachia endosymbiont of Folsomia candida]|uniref:F0F1 ATP synthase subunit A n=1 Tax=Wolbachia endosymbiont of Folsomia candida TaxID=169402 RepID=UPI000B2C92C8|nr:F0F1 ATP synthase subunit A [Wolbachia endosymbiont of Folsomia candida]APR98835.1 F0F1 ATP synthase subunit A [Wolbachia endosymbiont of Folsomia candida]